MMSEETSLQWGEKSRPGIQYVSTPFGDLRVRMEGTGEKTVVFIPDAPAMIEHHDGIFAARPDTFTFLSIEPIGTGFSIPDERFDFSFDQFSDSLLAVIDTLISGKVTLAVGCCNGYFALWMANKNPEKFEKFVIWQTAGWDQNRHFLDTWIDPNKQLRGPEGAAYYEQAKYSAVRWWFDVSGGPQANKGKMTKTAHESFDHGGCHCLAELVQSSVSEQAPAFEPVRLPVIILWCGADATHAKSSPDSFQVYWADSQIVHWDDAGHMPDLEFPDRLVDLISAL